MLELAIGFIIGFLLAIPAIGPISATVIERSLAGDYFHGFAIGAGSSLAEALYCFAALVGVGFLFARAPWLRPFLQWGGVVILLGVGLYFIVGPTPKGASDHEKKSISVASAGVAALLGFLVTLFNPSMIATWATAVSTMVSVGGLEFHAWHRWAFPLAVALGELTWFGVFIYLIDRLGDAIDDKMIEGAIRVIGLLLVGLAIWGGVSLVV